MTEFSERDTPTRRHTPQRHGAGVGDAQRAPLRAAPQSRAAFRFAFEPHNAIVVEQTQTDSEKLKQTSVPSRKGKPSLTSSEIRSSEFSRQASDLGMPPLLLNCVVGKSPYCCGRSCTEWTSPRTSPTRGSARPASQHYSVAHLRVRTCFHLQVPSSRQVTSFTSRGRFFEMGTGGGECLKQSVCVGKQSLDEY